MSRKNTQKPPSTRKDFLVFGAPALEEDEIEEVVATLRSGWIGTGPKVKQFEEDFAAYKGVHSTQVAAVNSCTAALHLCMIAANIGPGDEVITTAMTFCATVNAIIHSGATPVLADIDPDTMNIDPAEIECKITSKTKAILPVHFAGYPCDMAAIMDIADRHGLKVIEDCAHAIETEYKGQKAGTFGDFSCFSFYVTKNVVTGEGGMVIAKNEDDINRIKRLALHGMSQDAWHRFGDDGFKHYKVVECGYKYNMTDIQAALGIHQLARVDENWQRREKVWNSYQQAFSNLPIDCPKNLNNNNKHAYHLYTLQLNEERCGISRDRFLEQMTKQNIGVGVHYQSIAEHPYYQNIFNWKTGEFPKAKSVGHRTVSLPLSPSLGHTDIGHVITAVQKLLA